MPLDTMRTSDGNFVLWLLPFRLGIISHPDCTRKAENYTRRRKKNNRNLVNCWRLQSTETTPRNVCVILRKNQKWRIENLIFSSSSSSKYILILNPIKPRCNLLSSLYYGYVYKASAKQNLITFEDLMLMNCIVLFVWPL